MMKIRQYYQYIKAFSSKVAMHFSQDVCVYRAAALTIDTLLALVPLIIVVLNILSAFHHFQDYAQKLTNILLTHLVPSSGEVVKSYMLGFIAQASQLSIAGLIGLVATAILLLYTIEQAFNSIWRVHSRQCGVAMIIRYWAVLTLLPLFMVAGIALTSFLFHLPEMDTLHTQPWLIESFKFLLAVLIFSFLYGVIPNYRVPLPSVILSAFFAAVCFTLVKKVFVIYIIHFTNYQILYGTLAALPVFIIWLYCLWLITLLGAEVNRAIVFR